MSKRKRSRFGFKGISFSPMTQTPPMRDRRAMEALTAKIEELMFNQNFSSIEDANAFLTQHVAGMKLNDVELNTKTPLEEAQALMWKAFDEPSMKKRIKMANEAITISPDCADAYIMLAETTFSSEDELTYYRRGMEAGKRAIKDILEKEPKDFPFWKVLSTRPYMRAVNGLAAALYTNGEVEEALPFWRELLRLNPDDNQGVRWLLLPALLETAQLDEANELLTKYDEDVSACWSYSRALYLYKTLGDVKAARDALKTAIAKNKYVIEYLLGIRKLSDSVGSYTFGSPEEAQEYISAGVAGWVQDESAVEWVADCISAQFLRNKHRGSETPASK